MEKREFLVLTLFLITFMSVAFASAIQIQQSSLGVSVIPEFNQPGKATLEITGATPGNYNLYTLTAVKLLPATPFYLTDGTNEVNVDVYPTDQLVAQAPATYSFTVELRSIDTNQNVEGSMTVRVVSLEDAFEISSDSNSPDSNTISFYIQNREAIDLNNVHAKFSSIFFDLDQTFNIKANEKKVFEISVDPAKLKKIEAGSYLLTAQIDTDRGTKTLEGRISLDQKTGVQSLDSSTGFFVPTRNISKINNGNVNEDAVITAQKDVISRLFTSFNIEPTSVNRDGFTVTYTWNKQLGPSDELNVIVKTNYLLPLVVILAIVLLILGIKRYTETKIEITKSVTPIKTKTGQFALKIKLYIKAKKRVGNVSIIDRIPGVVQIYEKFESVVRPTKIDAKNRRIQWDIGEMGAGDERIFNYMVYSNVGVVGKFALPQALAVYEKDGQIHETESNNIYFLAEQRSPDEK